MRTGGALIVARKNASRAWRVKAIAEHAIQTGVKIVGSVMNDY
jgi:hypothetical protein